MVAGLHVCAAGVSMPDGFEDEQVYGHMSREPLPMDQVKEAREGDIRLLTEHSMFEIVPESEVSCVAGRLWGSWREKQAGGEGVHAHPSMRGAFAVRRTGRDLHGKHSETWCGKISLNTASTK